MTELKDLATREAEGIVISLASLVFVRSQGRALPEDSDKLFVAFIRDHVWPSLSRLCTAGAFAQRHDVWVASLCRLFGGNGPTRAYGQGQKALNVWLKFYVDYASLPDAATANRLRPWLHCPLDSVVMGGLKERYPQEYRRRIEPHYTRLGVVYQRRHSLTMMDKRLYGVWQDWIRELSPTKPLLVDLMWAFER